MEVLEPRTEQHTHTVVFLHGRGSTAQEFSAELFESETSDNQTLTDMFPNIRWTFPTADKILSTRFDCHMSQWFDMHSTADPHEHEAQQDLNPSIERTQKIIAKETELIGAENVFLCGISQGSALAVHALLKGQVRLGGFIGLCTWLPKADSIAALEITPAMKTPVLLCHSEDDEVINIRYGRELRDALAKLGMEVQWHSYMDGGHWINEPQGVDDIVRFLKGFMIRETKG